MGITSLKPRFEVNMRLFAQFPNGSLNKLSLPVAFPNKIFHNDWGEKSIVFF